jgi:hypothetical protein
VRSALADGHPDRRWLAGLAALAVVAAGGTVTWAVLDDPSYDASPPGSAVPRARPAEAAVALQGLASALAAEDPDAAAGLAPPGDGSAASQLRVVADNARELGLSVAFRYVDETGAVAADGTWTAAVAATWRYAGDTGTEPAEAEVSVRFSPVGDDEVAIAGLGLPDAGRVPVWLSGPVVVARAPGRLVVVSGDGALVKSEARRYRRLASSAVDIVRVVLPSWRGRLVVEVPGSSAALDRAMDVEPGHSSGIAAVTVPVDGSTDTDSPVHVFVNPEVFDRLPRTGAQVVLSHEAAHVATEASRSSVAPWLVEGFADYVALRDVHLPVSTTAAQIIQQVRREGVPAALPGPAEFATGTTHLGATYESAWLACVLLADRGGERALVRFYDDVSAGSPLPTALRQGFGLTEAGLTRLWRRHLADLAG